MAKSLLSIDQLTSLAARGAAAAIAELEAQIAAIKRAFPSVANSGRAAGGGRGQGRTGRRRMSAAARKAVSARMKKRWAAYRAAKAKSAGKKKVGRRSAGRRRKAVADKSGND